VTKSGNFKIEVVDIKEELEKVKGISDQYSHKNVVYQSGAG
jgi:hypothetical protein